MEQLNQKVLLLKIWLVAFQKHTQKHIVFSIIFCVSSCGGGNGQQRWPSHVFNKEIIKKLFFSGRAVPPDETQNVVENTICFCVCFWYASGMLLVCCQCAVGDVHYNASGMPLVCCWPCALQRQTQARTSSKNHFGSRARCHTRRIVMSLAATSGNLNYLAHCISGRGNSVP